MESVRPYPRTFVGFSERAVVLFVSILFFTSGFAALLYQVIWQRVLAVFSGADVYSVTIIVAAFMAGLGCGSLAGGYIADRVSLGRRIALFALSELAIALFAFASKWLFYDVLYGQFNGLAGSPPVLAGVLFLSLLWPTFFMGVSLPLLSKTLTRRIEHASGMIGSLYAVNTLGAAVGAFITTWLFIRNFGFETTVIIGAFLNIVAAIGAVAVAPYFLRQDEGRRTKDEGRKTKDERETADDGQRLAGDTQSAIRNPQFSVFPVPVWIAIYGLSGFVALSLEIVWFRLLGVMLKSTAFTFGNLLAVFLAGLAYGTFRGIEWAKTARHPARIFLGLQAGVALYAGLSITLLVALLNNTPALGPLWTYLGGDGALDINASWRAVGQFASGAITADVERRALQFISLYFVLPLILIGPPTLLMGLSFPLLQKVVQSDVATLGRRVGWLQTANIFGSMLGAVLTGWVFLQFLGTANTLRLLLVFGGFFALLYIYARFVGQPTRRLALGGVTLLGALLLIFMVPQSHQLWTKLHGTTPDKLIADEDGSGLAVIKDESNLQEGWKSVIYANGLGQSHLPFPDHHTLLGMLPIMMHPDPEEMAIIGLGSGATLFAAGGREETQSIMCVEIIAPQLPTLVELQRQHPYGGLQSLLEDKRIDYVFADGRAVLMLGNKKYDIIEADALHPTSAYAGNLYSHEYFTLMKDHLKPGGLAVSWTPTSRVERTFTTVFPYVMVFGDFVVVGSNEPFELDRAAAIERLQSRFSRSYYARAGIDVDDFVSIFREAKPVIRWPDYDRSQLTDINSDLYPKDEYLVP